MPTPPDATYGSVVPVLAIVVVVLVLRTLRIARGARTRYSPGRLFGFTAFYAFFFGLLGASTVATAFVTLGTPALALLAPYVAVPVVAAVVAAPYVRRIVRFDRRPGGVTHYRLPAVVPTLSLALFVVRLVVGLALLGGPVTATFPPPAVGADVLVVLVAIDLLFGVSVGLLAGRAGGVRAAYRALPPPSAAEGPLPSSGPLEPSRARR